MRGRREEVDANVDCFDDNIAFQVEGNDLVHVSDIAEDGTATVRVFASTHSAAAVIFDGVVNIFAHLAANKQD